VLLERRSQQFYGHGANDVGALSTLRLGRGFDPGVGVLLEVAHDRAHGLRTEQLLHTVVELAGSVALETGDDVVLLRGGCAIEQKTNGKRQTCGRRAVQGHGRQSQL
jgi:hypothetical protein